MKRKNMVALILILILITLGITYKVLPKIVLNDKNKSNEVIENKTTEEKKDYATLNLTVVGDFLFESPYYKSIENGDSKDLYFNKVKSYFNDDDISIGNMEVVIGNDNMKISGDGYNFCAPSWIGPLVSSLDLEVLSTANNHSYDRGVEGINSTIDYFKNNTDIVTLGTEKQGNTRKTRIIEKNGLKIGFSSFTLGTNIKPSKENVSLINYYKDPYTKEILKNQISEEISYLKKNADIIITLMHWGTEFTFYPNDEQKEMANYLNSLGVDIIVGSHSHSIQPIEIIGEDKKTLVYYSLGNFVSADDDIARTPKGQETFDNAYQFGLLSKISLKINKDNNIEFDNIKTEPIINYFNKDMRNFELIPLSEYNEIYEKSHYRFNLGLSKDFINKTFNNVIDENFR